MPPSRKHFYFDSFLIFIAEIQSQSKLHNIPFVKHSFRIHFDTIHFEKIKYKFI